MKFKVGDKVKINAKQFSAHGQEASIVRVLEKQGLYEVQLGENIFMMDDRLLTEGRRRFVKKPIVIEAILWDGSNKEEVENFIENEELYLFTEPNTLKINTLEGDMIVSVGDYIIKGVNGEFYPCKPDIFEKTYEEVL